MQFFRVFAALLMVLALAFPLPLAAQQKKPHHGIARHVGHGAKKAARGVRWVVW